MSLSLPVCLYAILPGTSQRYIREVEVLPGYGTVDERQRIISPLIASGGFFGMDKDSPY
jgi:hypothetical protein